MDERIQKWKAIWKRLMDEYGEQIMVELCEKAGLSSGGRRLMGMKRMD